MPRQPEPSNRDNGNRRSRFEGEIRFTRTGAISLAVCLFFYIAALTSQSSLLITLIGLLVGCVLVNAVQALTTLSALHVNAPRITRIREGGTGTVPWPCSQSSRRATQIVQLRLGKGGPHILQLDPIPPGGKTNPIPSATSLQRGSYSSNRLWLECAGPFGLVIASRPLGLDTRLVIHPALDSVAPPDAGGFEPVVGGSHTGRRITQSGGLFSGIRPLIPGDPMRQIHWPSSARGHGLMVKTYTEELSGRCAIFLDLALPPKGTPPANLEPGIRLAGSLAFAALDAGHHILWATSSTHAFELVPPFSDGQELLDELAGLQGIKLPQEPATQPLLRIPHRIPLTLVLTWPNPSLLQAASETARLGTPVRVWLPSFDPALAAAHSHLGFQSWEPNPPTQRP